MHFDSLPDWLAWQESLHPLTIDLGLERVATVFAALNPNYAKPPTITVAGTNGKGSCIATLEAIYLAQGYHVGSYTSPHILKYNERIKIDGVPVSDELICAAFAKIEAARGNISLSYFEFSTLAALEIFTHSKVNVQLLEVGLGGRLDAVNIIDPDIAIISSIGIDHVDWLGKTREAIGWEKAGIFRTATPAVIGDLDPPNSLLQSAVNKNTPAYYIGKDFGYKKKLSGWHWFSGNASLDLPNPVLKGEHQYRNAAAVIFAVTTLAKRLPISEKAIQQGLRNVELSGRFQLINTEIPTLLDVGHNPEAVKTLLEYLITTFPEKRIHAVFSMMKDKDIASVLEIMNPVVYDWFFAPLANPRVATEAMMQKIFSQSSVAHVSFGFTDFAEAYQAAKSQAQQGDLLLVFGSFLLVSDCVINLKQSELTT
ncbi:bifunctional folylpolyglutamate synthase/dihydrofolate synthase [Crenothrix sp. D3]|jgi:dihydrofolate synthase/folylpolyglutamate synthase|nr:bifunctional folylpolyglutamate synthase/dihydrofolate synthase [Crenothrix sp. D3]